MKHEMTTREFKKATERMCNEYDWFCRNGTGTCPLINECSPLEFLTDSMIAAVEQWAAEHPEKKRKTYAEDFLEKFPNTKIYKEENRPGFCRKEIYEGKSGYCAGYARGDCIACWNQEMEDADGQL